MHKGLRIWAFFSVLMAAVLGREISSQTIDMPLRIVNQEIYTQLSSVSSSNDRQIQPFDLSTTVRGQEQSSERSLTRRLMSHSQAAAAIFCAKTVQIRRIQYINHFTFVPCDTAYRIAFRRINV